jgi:hypothetical protein
LKSLYEKGKSNNNIDEIFNFSSNYLWVWSKKIEEDYSSSGYFLFYYGGESWPPHGHPGSARALLVRGRART